MGEPLPVFSTAEYLAWEAEQVERHEFVRGDVFAMVGARRVHGIVSLNIAAALKGQLRGSRCRVFHETMKLQAADDAVFYPDVFVTCDEQDLRTDVVFRAPTAVVEVLSPSTQAWDRGQKFAWYLRLASLREYLLVDPDTREALLFRRGEQGLFTLHDLTGAPSIDLASIGCTLPADEVFDGLEPPMQGTLPGV